MTVVTGVETNWIRTVSGGNVVVVVVVLIVVLAEVVASLVVHLTVVRVVEPTVIVKSALTLSRRPKKTKILNIIVQHDLKYSQHILRADKKVDERLRPA